MVAGLLRKLSIFGVFGFIVGLSFIAATSADDVQNVATKKGLPMGRRADGDLVYTLTQQHTIDTTSHITTTKLKTKTKTDVEQTTDIATETSSSTHTQKIYYTASTTTDVITSTSKLGTVYVSVVWVNPDDYAQQVLQAAQGDDTVTSGDDNSN